MIVGIAGHIGIGKTYLANNLYNIFNTMKIPVKKDSFARKVKEFAKDIFFITKEGHYLKNMFPYDDYMDDIAKYLTQESPSVIKKIRPHITNQDALDFLEEVVTNVSSKEVLALLKVWIEYYTPSFNEDMRKQMARKILQLIGKMGREIQAEYWVNFVVKDNEPNTIILVDDLRFINEANYIDFIIVLMPTSIGTYFELVEQRKVKVDINMLKDISEREWGIIAQEVLSGKKKGTVVFVENNNSIDTGMINYLAGTILLEYDRVRGYEAIS